MGSSNTGSSAGGGGGGTSETDAGRRRKTDGSVSDPDVGWRYTVLRRREGKDGRGGEVMLGGFKYVVMQQTLTKHALILPVETEGTHPTQERAAEPTTPHLTRHSR